MSLKQKVIKPKKCAYRLCRQEFTPTYSTLQIVCSPRCGLLHSQDKAKEAEKKDWNVQKKAIRQKLKTHKDYLKELREVFHEFIRLRDADKPCVCCNRPLAEKYDAGHYYAAGQNMAVRFDEDNVHAQNVYCNRDLHGNLIAYGEKLLLRIGQERFDALKERQRSGRKFSIPELIEMKEYYKIKVKELKETRIQSKIYEEV